MTERKFDALGKSGVSEGKLEAFDRPADSYLSRVKMVSDEVTSRCPITGQPDFYTVSIEYEPDGLCLESKSLKLYLGALRDTGAFGEDLADRICKDVFEILQPVLVKVDVTQKSRGGIVIVATAFHSRMS